MDTETSEAVETLQIEIRRVETSLSAKMLELNDDAKRHMDVVSESLRDDIRIIAEGVVSLSAKVDSLRR